MVWIMSRCQPFGQSWSMVVSMLFFLILFGKNLDTFVMDFSRDRRKTPSADLENLLGHTYPFIASRPDAPNCMVPLARPRL